MLSNFWPQISIIASVLIHIQVETQNGMFDLTAYRIESFEQGWLRYLYFKIFDQKPPMDKPELNWKLLLDKEGTEIKLKNGSPELEGIDMDSSSLSDS
jgi:hypothetical protein